MNTHRITPRFLVTALALVIALAFGFSQLAAHFGAPVALLALLALSQLGAPRARFSFGASANNSIDVGLKKEILLDTFLEEFVKELLPLSAFATDFSDSVIDEGDKIKLGYVPAAAAARAFEGQYLIQKSDYQYIDLVIDQHDYVSWGLSDKDLFSGSIVNLQTQARQKAASLAALVQTKILGVVTAANFPNVAFTGAANTFDLDDVADMRTGVVKAKWPKGARNMILGADYYGAVIKDNNFQDASAAGSTTTRETGDLPRLYTFAPYESEAIPENGENLIGFVNMPSAIGVGMRYLAPRRPEKYIAARPVKDAKTGITFGFRQDYDTTTGVEGWFFECNYGFKKLEGAALRRMKSA